MSLPSQFIIENAALFGNLAELKVLDLACGSGRNGLWFAKQGAEVTFIDINKHALAKIKQTCEHSQYAAHTVCLDLETPEPPTLPDEQYHIIIVCRYLHRPLFPLIKQLAHSGGFVCYETFTLDQPQFGRPSNPAFLLNKGELQDCFKQWEILHQFEGIQAQSPAESKQYQAIAQVIARKP